MADDDKKITTDQLKERFPDFENEVEEIRSTLARLEGRIDDHIKDSAIYRQTTADEIAKLDRGVDSLMKTVSGNGLQKSVNRLVLLVDGDDDVGFVGLRQTLDGVAQGQAANAEKIEDVVRYIDGDSKLGVVGIRTSVEAVRVGQIQNAEKIDTAASNWGDLLRRFKWVLAAFLFGFGFNIVFGLFMLWAISHNAPISIPGIP